MPNPPLPSRQSIRLDGYDYSLPGAYFVTLVTQNRINWFGQICDGVIQLSEIGCVVQEEWFHTAQLRPYVRMETDEFIIMPNHIHGIIWIVAELDRPGSTPVGAQRRCARTLQNANTPEVTPGSLGAIVRAYKSAVTYRVNALREMRGVRFWQRNYYEHILRTDDELERVRA
jgi:REP element-mobilizing transposase RayT